jgi:protein involved in polysaccharide export with SLBB domain
MRGVLLSTVFFVSVLGLSLGSLAQQQDQSPQTVGIFGQVNLPGVYILKSNGLTLVHAIAMAQGFTARADEKAVIITSKDGSKTTVDLGAILNGSTPDVPLKAGDVVRVPELRR